MFFIYHINFFSGFQLKNRENSQRAGDDFPFTRMSEKTSEFNSGEYVTWRH